MIYSYLGNAAAMRNAWLAVSVAAIAIVFVLVSCRSRQGTATEKSATWQSHRAAWTMALPIEPYLVDRTAILITGDRPEALSVIDGILRIEMPPGGQATVGRAAIVGSDGRLLTAAHTLHDGRPCWAYTGRGAALPAHQATLVRRGSVMGSGGDWAELHIAASDLPALPIRHEPIAIGETIFAFGIGFTAGRVLGSEMQAESALVFHDAPTEIGDSGGPVIDRQGRLIGIQSRIIGTMTGNRVMCVRPR